MADGIQVASLFAALGIRIDQSAFDAARAKLQGAQAAANSAGAATSALGARLRDAKGRYVGMGGAAAGAGAAAKGAGDAAEEAGHRAKRGADKASEGWASVGGAIKLAVATLVGGAAYNAMISFNAAVEDSKNQIAGMLALTKKTHLSDELATADTLMGNLQRRAATLPGTTAEYVSMLSNITRPIVDAKLSMQDLEDITVNSVVAAKALSVDAGAAARDIDQALRGQYHSVDQFTGKVLGSIGYEGEAGRKKYNALTKEKRATELKRAITQPQITELAEAQGKSFNGVMSTLKDATEQFLAKVGLPLFKRLGETIRDINAWLDKNAAKVQMVADAVGGALRWAFDAVSSAIGIVGEFLGEHLDEIRSWASDFAAMVTEISSGIASFLADNKETIKQYYDELFSDSIAVGRAVLQGVRAVIEFIKEHSTIAKFLGAVLTIPLWGLMAIQKALHWLIDIAPAIGDALGSAFRAVADWVSSAFDKIMAVGRRIYDFFVHDLPDAIKGAWDYASGGVGKVMDALAKVASGRGTQPVAPAMPAGASASPQVNVGGMNITVNSNAADPKEVAAQVHKGIDEKLGNVLRRAKDATS